MQFAWGFFFLGGKKENHSVLAIYNQTFLEFQHVITDTKRFNSSLTMEQANPSDFEILNCFDLVDYK